MFMTVSAVNAANDKAIFGLSLGDYSEELTEAKEQGKKGVLLFFEMDECPFCHRMKTTVLNQPEVIAYLKKHFLVFSIDIEGDVEINDFAGNAMPMKDFAFKQNRVRATPVFAFYDLEGNIVTKYTGPTSGVEEMMWLGEYVVNEHYKTMRFTKFKKIKREEIKNNKK
ncbi:MAG: thioredoxin fold domain-containing protein [Gammaproteobacteria bacterium]|nr:thioredoxin fold domain-containing protein [Gammaproteobacteria bacterium]